MPETGTPVKLMAAIERVRAAIRHELLELNHNESMKLLSVTRFDCIDDMDRLDPKGSH